MRIYNLFALVGLLMIGGGLALVSVPLSLVATGSLLLLCGLFLAKNAGPVDAG